jgi:hypothetical protein
VSHPVRGGEAVSSGGRSGSGLRDPLDDNALADGVEDDFGCVVEVELLHQVRAMGLDRGQPEIQQRGHFLVRSCFREQLEDLRLAVRQEMK